jgi:hypothetical protein
MDSFLHGSVGWIELALGGFFRDQVFSDLRNLYWHLRMVRAHDSAGRRRRYRQIQDEKKRLLEVGVSQIKIHLICRVLTNPKNKAARERLAAYLCQGSLLDGTIE